MQSLMIECQGLNIEKAMQSKVMSDNNTLQTKYIEGDECPSINTKDLSDTHMQEQRNTISIHLICIGYGVLTLRYLMWMHLLDAINAIDILLNLKKCQRLSCINRIVEAENKPHQTWILPNHY
eukprot:1015212_1